MSYIWVGKWGIWVENTKTKEGFWYNHNSERFLTNSEEEAKNLNFIPCKGFSYTVKPYADAEGNAITSENENSRKTLPEITEVRSTQSIKETLKESIKED